jgi:hypothetical protein
MTWLDRKTTKPKPLILPPRDGEAALLEASHRADAAAIELERALQQRKEAVRHLIQQTHGLGPRGRLNRLFVGSSAQRSLAAHGELRTLLDLPYFVRRGCMTFTDDARRALGATAAHRTDDTNAAPADSGFEENPHAEALG